MSRVARPRKAPPISAPDAFADKLRSVVRPLVPEERALERLLAACRVRQLVKGDVTLRAGAVADDVLFVRTGLLRTAYVDAATGEERTGQFFDAGLVFTDAQSFLARTPATQTIEALEPSEVLAVPRAALLAAYDADHAIERFGRLMLEEALMGSQRRSASLLNLSLAERYAYFVRTRPAVAGRVPQYLIASYLGVTPEALSRARARTARRGEA